MVAVLMVVEQRQRAAVIEEAERRGQVLARDLAAISQLPLMLYNFTPLEQAVARLATEDDVQYAIVLDNEGRVAAHSARQERVGLVLAGEVERRAAAPTEPVTQESVTRAGRAVYDRAVPRI